jgi:hypothetical protein
MENYKFIGEDDQTFKVQHPDGSEFSIAKNAVGPQVHKKIKALEPVKMNEGGEVPAISDESSSSQNELGPMFEPLKIPEKNQQLAVEPDLETISRSPAQAPHPLEIEPINNAAASAAIQQPVLPQSQPIVQQANPLDPNAMNSAQSGALGQRESAIKQAGMAQENSYQAQANVWQNLVKEEQKANAEAAQKLAPLEAKSQELFKAVADGKVDHNRLYSNMSTGNKVLAAISVGLSGLGSGLTGQSNMAMDVIQKSIDRDIESQKIDLGKKQTLFSENLRLIGDTKSALLATKAQLLSAAQAQVQAYSAQANSAQAKLNAQVMLTDLDLQKQKLNQEAVARQLGRQGGNFDPSVLVPRLVPEHKQAEVFKEIKDAMNIRSGGNEALDAFDKADKEQSLFSKNVIPGVNSPYIGKIKAAVLPQFQNIDGTVRQAAMDAFLPTITPQVGDSAHTIAVKRETLKAWLIAHSAAPTAKGFDIDLDKFGSTTTQQPEIQTMKGVQYQKVNGGWQRVK